MSIRAYIRIRVKFIAFICMVFMIFALFFYLADLNLRQVYYPALLSIAAGLIAGGADYIAIRKRHIRFSEIKSSAELEMMPEALDESDRDYERIVKLIDDERRSEKTQYAIRMKDSSDYYAAWAHQIKTPISAMKLILQNEDSESGRQLSRELTRVEQYADMVMVYVRLDSGSSDLVLKRIDIDSVIRSAVRRFAAEFIGKKTGLVFNETGAHKLSDAKWLQFVIEQILSNSLKYTEKGNISIYMSDENTLCIEDEGIGIASEDLPRVFDRGYTGYNGRRNCEASGIGLYLCAGVCRKLGHRIRAESEIGKGTRIYIEFGDDVRHE